MNEYEIKFTSSSLNSLSVCWVLCCLWTDCNFMLMREIKLVGQKRQGSRFYLFAMYECPVCGQQVEKIKKDGDKAKACSHDCYAKTRQLRGAYKSGFVMISGYKYEYLPKHPNATKKGYVAVHRLVGERKIGRYLRHDEVAHHKNEIKTDNRTGNIQVMTKSEHSRHHQNFRKCRTEL